MSREQGVQLAARSHPTAEAAYDKASGISKVLLTWINPIIETSNVKPLDFEDLGTLSSRYRSDRLASDFLIKGCIQSFKDLDSLWSLIWALFRVFGFELVVSGTFKLFGDCAALTSPVILKMLLRLIKAKRASPESVDSSDWKKAILLSVVIFLSQSLNTFTVNFYFQRTVHCGFKVRVSLTDMMYKKSLKLSMFARKEFSPSKIVNLVSVDAFRVDLAISFLHYLWSGPFQALVIVTMLYRLLGWSSFIGLALFVLFFPVQGRVVASISRQRKRISQCTDQRLKLMSELINGIKIIKTHAWEEEIVKRVVDVRTTELKNIHRIQNLQATMATITWLVPVFACIGTFLVFHHLTGELPIDRVLPALAYFNLLRLPLALLPAVIGFATDAKVSLTRIADLFGAEERQNYIKEAEEECVTIDSAEFSWSKGTSGQEFRLSIDRLAVKFGELVCITGPIGSGKSTLVQAILGEVYLLRGSVHMKRSQRIAYCPQVAWIITGTIRDNILFGLEYRETLYNWTLDVCQLRADLELLPAGDLTIIGERGTNLSGGQKQRLSIARAVYSRADCYIFDDPLSALDAKVANAIWEECICRVLAGKTRIIVTHSNKHAVGNRTVTIDNGRIVSDIRATNGGESRTPPIHSADGTQDIQKVKNGDSASGKDVESIEEEDRVVGGISGNVVSTYAGYFGGLSFISLVLFALILNQTVRVASDIWLSSEENMESVGKQQFAIVYGMAGILQGVFVYAICRLFNAGAIAAAVRLHDAALQGLIRSPLQFFEKTSSGRILNRFSKDVDAADNQSAECLRTVAMTAIGVLSTLLLTICLSWPAIFTIIPALYFFNRVQQRFRPPAREIKRLDALSKAPVFSHISESLTGVQTIRAYHDEDRFIRQLEAVIDKNNVPVFLYLSLQRWVSVRLEMIGNLIILSASVFAYATANLFAFAGLSIVYSLNTTGALNWLIRRFAEAESQMIACERLIFYASELPVEEDVGGKEVSKDWPEKGQIQVSNLTISYRVDRAPALIDFNLSIKPGEHVGIVGRTGAGKSTIISAFFRLYNMATTGSIVIDGIDISQVPLVRLRRRLAIIPQDPVLFSGTVRSNLDPFGKHSDDDMWLALDRSGLAPIIHRSPTGLDAIVDAQGENWSAGERQLLCLARALLAKAKIILLDEATSSVDPKTDATIQECIAKDLAGSTVLIVAHRLDTIMHCDRVIVLEAGRIVEQGPPKELAIADGPFGKLLRQQSSQQSMVIN